MGWMRVLSFILSLSSCCYATCDATYKVKSICPMSYGSALNTYSTIRSKVECSVVCSQDGACLSAVFDGLAGTCNTYSDYISVQPCASEQFYAGVFESSCFVPPVISGGIFSLCDLNIECQVPSSECRDMKCQCVPGLSYDPGTQTCVTTCTEYGSTFQDNLDHLLVGFSEKSYSISDPEECKSACVNETGIICRSAELWKSGAVCYLSTDTAYTQPQAWEANPGYNLYQRDCAP